MRKTFIILILFVAALFTSEKSAGQFVFGLKLGYNASKLSTDLDSIKSSFGSGFHAGAFFRIGKRVHLQPEIYYTLSASSVENQGTNTLNNWEQKITVGSLDIPVLVGINIIQSKLIKWRIMAGPEVSFVVNSKIKDVSLTGPVENSNINTTNWYIQAGTGIDILFLTLDLRYQAGLNSIINDVTASDNKVYPVNSKGNLFVVSLGFKLL
jgi:hypothetical protein